MGEIPGDFAATHDERAGAVAFLAAVEEAEGFRDPARFAVVFEGDGLAHDGPLVLGGVCAQGHGDVAEVLGRRAIVDHVASRQHPVAVHRRQLAEGQRELLASAHGSQRGTGTAAEASARAPVQRAIHQNVFAKAERHRHGRIRDREAGEAPTAEEIDVPVGGFESQGLGDAADRGGVAHRIGDHAVDIAGHQAGVPDGAHGSLQGECFHREAGLSAEGRVAHARDGSAVPCEVFGAHFAR